MGSGGSKKQEVKTDSAQVNKAAASNAPMDAEEKAKHEKLVARIEQQQAELQKAA